MKELSIEEKAKCYDNRLEKAKKWYDTNTNEGYRSIFEDIFPELKESNDEMIMKELKHYLEVKRCQTNDNAEYINCNNFLAWLKKQSDKDEEILILKDQIESLHAAIKAIKETHKIKLEKQGEQKPVWNEDDKENFELAIYLLEKAKEDAPDGLSDEQGLDVTDYKNVIKWLKSLKNRVGCEVNMMKSAF